jgi:sortase A
MTLRFEYRISSAEPCPLHVDPSVTESSSSILRTRSKWLSRWAAPIALFLVGCLALGYYAYDILDARFFQEDQSRRFDNALRDAHASNASAPAASLSPADQLRAEALADLDSRSSRGSSSPAIALPKFDESTGANRLTSSPNRLAENIPLGRIEIDSIGLKAMIQEGTGSRTLQRGIGHITGTALLGHSGNVGLAGHRDTFFRKLRDIHQGDEITLTTLTGTYVYRVGLISIVEPEESSVLRDSGESVLTLVTCYPFSYIGPAPKRFIVRAQQVPSDSSAATATK